jgi:FkbM family methyltransferase
MPLPVKTKLVLARILNRCLRLGRGLAGKDMRAVCRRGGVRWDLDLNEGIDLCIYLFGAYEGPVRRNYRSLIRPGAVIFDIGANIGAHTLPFADFAAEGGRVYAFEPTDFAFAKLRRNLALNPRLAGRVHPKQRLLVENDRTAPPPTICASWPVNRWTSPVTEADIDAWHLGRGMALAGASLATADRCFEEEGLDRLDLVKIDVDGNEASVLRGFRRALAAHRPAIVIELAPSVHDRNCGNTFDDYVGFLAGLGYRFRDATTLRPLPADGPALRALIPSGASVNALLTVDRT